MQNSQRERFGVFDAAPEYEIYAIRYATVERTRSENFAAVPDDHAASMPLDYFVWVLRGNGKVWLVDTGFNAAMAATRGRNFLHCPIASLDALGLAARDVSDVLITHLHYDHAGNLDRLQHADIHVQEREMQFATGCNMCHPLFRLPYAVDDVVEVVRSLYGGRVIFYAGDAHVAPGIDVLWIGGHTDGLQSVCVNTRRGPVILASDAAHFYENLTAESPYPIVYHVGDMVRGWQRLKQIALSPDHIIPGHDPLVMKRYPKLASEHAEIAMLHHDRLAQQEHSAP
jgi:glyoxylase-like metal-dependent hydrolase (beta-lactamase superfamily II)